MEYRSVSRSSRRKFLFAGFVASVGRATTYAQQQAPIPETLTQWLGASAKMRKLALQRCLDRIQTMEPLIHAWVQVSPQRNTSRGRLSGIPYGVKDIVETRGLTPSRIFLLGAAGEQEENGLGASASGPAD